MTRAHLILLAATALVVVAPRARAQRPNPRIEAQQTAAGAIATDEHWSWAEIHGDTAFLNTFLLPDYRSVGADGVAHAKAAILAGTARRGADTVASVAAAAAYRAAHPHATRVALAGNTAVLSFYVPALGPDKGIRSADVLVYAAGRWHALYSEHTNVQ